MSLKLVPLALLLSALIAGCKSDMELIPNGEVTIYRSEEGNEILGLSSERLEVTRLIYPDKTDYVVQVRYKGQVGYVRKGAFHIERRKPGCSL